MKNELNEESMEVEQIRECAKRAIAESNLIEYMMVIAQMKRTFTENNIELTKENFDIAFSVAKVSSRVEVGCELYATRVIEITNKEHVIDVLKRYTQIKDIAYEI